MFKTILVPVDLGEIEAARPAIDRAVALADVAGGTVRLIYVRSLAPVTYMEFMPPTFDTEQQDVSEAKLAEVAASVKLPRTVYRPWCALARSTTRCSRRRRRRGRI